MRRFYLAATVLFWLLVAAFWAGSRGLPPAEESVAVVTEKSFSAGELASHATPENRGLQHENQRPRAQALCR